MKILIVEDNLILRENLEFLLKKFSYYAESAKDGEEGLRKISSGKYDAIVLDINMPNMSGREFLQKIRNAENHTPVLVLTSNSMLEDKVELFDMGADDYMTKPFEIEELVARLKSLLRRGATVQDTTQEFWDYNINFSTKKILQGEKQIFFSRKQYLILELLTKNIWYPLSKIKIMEYVWGEQEENLELASTTLESHIYVLRKQLWKGVIHTLKWVGYVIEK